MQRVPRYPRTIEEARPGRGSRGGPLLVLAGLLVLATGCQSVELDGTTSEIVETGRGKVPYALSSVLVRGFERTRQQTEVTPSVGFGIGVGIGSGGGGVSAGPSVGVSRQSYEIPVDDRALVAQTLNARGIPGSVQLVRGTRGSKSMRLEGRIAIGYENKILNGIYRGFFTIVPAIFFGLPYPEDGVLRLTASLYDPGGTLVHTVYVESRWSLWANLYSEDEWEERARRQALEAAVEEVATRIRDVLDERP